MRAVRYDEQRRVTLINRRCMVVRKSETELTASDPVFWTSLYGCVKGARSFGNAVPKTVYEIFGCTRSLETFLAVTAIRRELQLQVIFVAAKETTRLQLQA